MKILGKSALLLPLLALSLSACQKEAATPETSAPDAKPGISASNGTLVLPVVKGNPGAAYFDLTNGGDKSATLAAVNIQGAEKAEMHETIGGSMAPVAALEVKPGETAKFERGARHVMAFGIADTVKAGDKVELTLTFADGDKLSASLTVEGMGGTEGHAH